MESPNDFFVPGDLDDLRVVRAGVAVADAKVSVSEFLNIGDPGEGDSFEIILLKFPDDFLCGGYFDDAVPVPGCYKIIAVFGFDSSEALSSKSYRCYMMGDHVEKRVFSSFFFLSKIVENHRRSS